MSSIDFNLAKFNIPISVQRAFDKGKIADSYRQMYQVAVELASIEAKAREFQTYGEYAGNILNKEDEDQPSLGKMMKRVVNYQNKRIDYHMQNMMHLLELYAESRQKGNQPR
jgi:hypothetical protein